MRHRIVGLFVYLVILGFVLTSIMILYAQPRRGGGGGNPFDNMDRNGDGRLSKDEFKGPAQAFDNLDTDNDGYLSRQEMSGGKGNRGPQGKNIDKQKLEGAYPDLIVKVYNKDKAWPGNVIFVDKGRHRVIEASLDGKIVWEAKGPGEAVCDITGNTGGVCGYSLTDVELLPNDNVFILNGSDGVYEINRKGEVVWAYHDSLCSHDADRLPNGNVIMARVKSEAVSEFPYKDPQAIEVNSKGEIIWAWYAKTEYADSIYKDIRSGDAGDWTHMNSVQRLTDGNTLLSVRNWNQLIVVDSKGMTVSKTGAKEIPVKGHGTESPNSPHTPVLLDNGNIIVSEPMKCRVIEWDPKQEKVVWAYPDGQPDASRFFVRAAHRLPNGNTFIVDSWGQFVEVTSSGEIVWHAQIVDYKPPANKPSRADVVKAPFFNADRRGLSYYGGR